MKRVTFLYGDILKTNSMNCLLCKQMVPAPRPRIHRAVIYIGESADSAVKNVDVFLLFECVTCGTFKLKKLRITKHKLTGCKHSTCILYS